MASSVFLRPSLAVARRPQALLPFQLGTSVVHIICPDHATSITYHTYTKQHAVQQITSPMFPVAVRPHIFPLLPYIDNDDNDWYLVLNSDLQGHRERTDDFPPCEQVTRILPLDFRTSACRQPRPAHRRRLRDLWLVRPAPRWPARPQPHRPQPHRGAFSYNTPSFISFFT